MWRRIVVFVAGTGIFYCLMVDIWLAAHDYSKWAWAGWLTGNALVIWLFRESRAAGRDLRRMIRHPRLWWREANRATCPACDTDMPIRDLQDHKLTHDHGAWAMALRKVRTDEPDRHARPGADT